MNESVDPKTELLISRVAGNPRAMLALAQTLLIPQGKTARARQLCDEALEYAPDDAEVAAIVQLIRSRMVGQWYFTMVQDHPRHARYVEAFRQCLFPGCTVLDIGAGTGLFAMLAAREGAAQVIACERDPAVGELAREIIDRNGLGDRIHMAIKDSREIAIGTDLPERADVLLWDNLSNDLIGAGAVGTIEDARRRLLKPEAVIIPARCEIRVALVENDPAADLEMGTVEGFDLTPFNRFRPTRIMSSRSRMKRRSDATSIFHFDFTADQSIAPRSAQVEVKATGGRVAGVAQWLRFHLTDEIIYDTGDDDGVMAFGLQYHAVEPFIPEAGQRIMIDGAHDRQGMWFWINDRPAS